METKIIRGDTNHLVVEVTYALDGSGNQISSLNGYSAKMQARYTPNDPTPLFTKTGIIDGMKVLVTLSPSDTADLQGGERLVADVELTDNVGNKVTVTGDDGPFVLYVIPDVTR